MPGGDGTVPIGQGPGTGRGPGRGIEGGFPPGTEEKCVFTSCGTKVDHQIGVSCYEIHCPQVWNQND